MNVHSFQPFITSDEQLHSFGACVRTVNLLRLQDDDGHGGGSRDFGATRPRVAIVVDAENCLDRLYGGFFSDWSCGGQWAHMLDFLATLISTFHQANVQLAFFFNGALEPDRFRDWQASQMKLKENVGNVLRHIQKRATPPPKAWWVPPCGLQTMLRLALKTLNCSVFSSVEDHRQEIMSFCWENGYHGIMADDAEYAMVNPPRYFSARALKMSFQFEITTVEYVMDEVAKSLDLNPNRFGFLGTLLGNHILTASDLEDFHQKLAPETKDPKYKVGFERVIRAVVNYIRTLPKIDDFDQIGKDVFGSATDPRIKKLRSSLQYYASCSQEGYLKHKPKFSKKKKRLANSIQTPEIAEAGNAEKRAFEEASKLEVATAAAKSSHTDLVERIALDLDQLDLNEAISVATKAMKETSALSSSKAPGPAGDGPATHRHLVTADDGESSTGMSVLQALASGVEVAPSAEGKYPGKKEPAAACAAARNDSLKSISIPDVHPEVFRTALERHRQSQMSPYVYQLLTRGEIKLPVVLEDHKAPDGVPPVHLMFRPLRQSVYAVIFNLNHQRFNRKQMEEGVRVNRRRLDELKKQAKKCKSEEERKGLLEKVESLSKQVTEAKPADPVEVRVREWLPYNDYTVPDSVDAVDMQWSVPTVQRLWFGSSVEDKQKRLRAFLSCLRCDDCPPLLTQANVPQHMLLLACVLRYVMTSPALTILRKPELDALLATAFSPELRNSRYLAEMKVDLITKRGVQLATMLNEGIEMAIMANDACGAPIPVQMCLPWSFFDGKLFHSKLRRANGARNLMELCDGRMDVVYAIERMRAAILHGLVPQYANATVAASSFAGGCRAGVPPMIARGGQLVVGGSVVGQWGANYGNGRQVGSSQHHLKKKEGRKASGSTRPKTAGRGITVATHEGNSVLAASLVIGSGSGDAVVTLEQGTHLVSL